MRTLNSIEPGQTAGQPASILVAKANHFLFQQGKGYTSKRLFSRHFKIKVCKYQFTCIINAHWQSAI